MTCVERSIGSEVEVHYMITGTSDKGTLTAVETSWIEITRNLGKRNQDILLVPWTAIRLLKPLAPPPTPANTLVRPAGLVEAAREDEPASENRA